MRTPPVLISSVLCLTYSERLFRAIQSGLRYHEAVFPCLSTPSEKALSALQDGFRPSSGTAAKGYAFLF